MELSENIWVGYWRHAIGMLVLVECENDMIYTFQVNVCYIRLTGQAVIISNYISFTLI